MLLRPPSTDSKGASCTAHCATAPGCVGAGRVGVLLEPHDPGRLVGQERPCDGIGGHWGSSDHSEKRYAVLIGVVHRAGRVSAPGEEQGVLDSERGTSEPLDIGSLNR